MRLTIEGNDCTPPVSGGYLIIKKDKQTFHVVTVPSPNLYADRYKDSISENDDTFEDDTSNEFTMNVWSSNVGVDWQLDIALSKNDDSLSERISVEYRANAF